MSPVDRRNFLKSTGVLAAGATFSGAGRFSSALGQTEPGQKLANGVPNAEKLGWRVGIQSYTFKRFSLFEAIEMTASLGLKYIETFSGHINCGCPPSLIETMKEKLHEAGITQSSHYEPLTAETAPRVFSYWKDTGLEMLISDPVRIPSGKGSMDWYEELAKDHGIKLVLTNHPKKHGAPYSDPDWVVEDCKDRSEWVGASCDNGHFMRDGFAPKDAVEKYIKIGKMYQFHFRDVDELGPEGVDVALGKGAADIEGILKEIHGNNLKPLFQLEYERDFDNPMLQLVPSVKYFNEVCGKLIVG